MTDITIKQITRQELPLLLPLMEHCFNMKVEEEYFKWKFLNNPSGEFVGFGAFKAGELLGFNGIIPERYIVNGREQIIFQLGDVMTHASIRRMGMFEKLANACYNQIRENHPLVVIGFGGEISTYGLLKMGWKKVKIFNYFFKHRIHCRWTALLNQPDKNYIVKPAGDLQEIVELHDSYTYRNEPIHQVFSKEYLSWKISNPRRKYHTLVCYHNGQAVGYIIYYLEDGKVFIFDFVVSNQKVSKALLKKAYKFCFENQCSGVISVAAAGSLMAKRLKKAGFLHNPFSKGPLHVRVPFMVLVDNKQDTNFLRPENWLIEPSGHDSL